MRAGGRHVGTVRRHTISIVLKLQSPALSAVSSKTFNRTLWTLFLGLLQSNQQFNALRTSLVGRWPQPYWLARCLTGRDVCPLRCLNWKWSKVREITVGLTQVGLVSPNFASQTSLKWTRSGKRRRRPPISTLYLNWKCSSPCLLLTNYTYEYLLQIERNPDITTSCSWCPPHNQPTHVVTVPYRGEEWKTDLLTLRDAVFWVSQLWIWGWWDCRFVSVWFVGQEWMNEWCFSA